MTYGTYKNFSRAILKTQREGLLDVDLLFIPTPGDDIYINSETIKAFMDAYTTIKAGFIISDHYEYLTDNIEGTKPVIQHLKPGYDPSNIIVPRRSNNPMLFSHGSLIAVSKPFINSRVFDDILTADPVTKIIKQFKQTDAAAIIGIYQTASRDSETGELILDYQIVTHDEYLCDQNNPILQMCIPGPGAPRYYRKEAILAAGGYPDLLYGEDAALSDQMLKQGFLIKRNLDEANYIAVRHSANTDSEELGTDILIKKNYAKYSFKISIIEELKHLVLCNSYYHKYNNRVGF